MTAPRIQHTITLPRSADPEAFERFMHERYFTAVHRGPTRVGQLASLTLLRRIDAYAGASSYLLDMGCEGMADRQLPRLDDDQVQVELDGFRAEIVFAGTWSEVAALDRSSVDV